MRRLSARARLNAFALAMLAGYVDAIGFIASGGFFLSFMSGNTTRLGVGFWENAQHAGLAAALIASFVAGVILASLLRRLTPLHGQSAVLGLMALVLAAAVLVGGTEPGISALLITAAAMGAENAVFERDGEVAVGLTYMTGNLVKFGQQLSSALAGPWHNDWLVYMGLWLSLAAGAALGALAYGRWGFAAIGAAALLAALMALNLRFGASDSSQKRERQPGER